ncbi:MAG: hypothetical protein CMM84_13210 [Rhodothermaceae bacterium]|nr:hypothetical protein [Rhodothermaceae bacterium]MBC14815.1 hypothetical protein [Rhodothermaceae bacterium]
MRAHLHLTTPDSDRFGREHAEPWDDRSGWYTHAATLEIEPEDTALAKLEAVFDLTQHGRDDWTDGDAVAWAAGDAAEVRSSYVGDVIVLEGADSSAVYEVGFAGFRRIDVAAEHVPPPRVVPPTPAEWDAEQEALGDRALGRRTVDDVLRSSEPRLDP